ncbi:MAG: NADH-quinone oxidoreductase subunit L [Acidobacteriota bacterium]
MNALTLLWLIPLLPFMGAALNGILGPKGRHGAVTAVGVGAPLLSLLLALGCLWQYATSVNPAPFQQTLYAWVAGPFQIDVSFLLDPLSCIMLFVVTFVGFLIHVYSAGYMAHEGGYQRYFVYLNLFMGSMLLLILGANYLVTFVGWEGVGLCSYLLIGFYYEQEFPPYAGQKAFIVNRIGDVGFLIGLFALMGAFGTLDYQRITAAIMANPDHLLQPYALGLSLASFVALFLFVGAIGKSAQIPLFVWLPDAMAGPTPVSALIHAATMVTAGVYMVVRSNAIYQLATGVSHFVAIIGALTAIFAATIGLAQNDIKKVLAYSTVSQLGYMFLAAGVGAYSSAIFHLGTHAFFKALLFLGSGSVIHAMSGEQDMRKMGGLAKHLPITSRTFILATVAIAGIPPLSGFFSKDEILGETFASGHYILWAVGMITAGLTACYMFRTVYMTFTGTFRGTHEQEHHVHESPASMTVPLIILAVGAALAGLVGIPGKLFGNEHLNWLHTWLSPVLARFPEHGAEHQASSATEWALMGVSVLVAVAGILVARALWGRGRGLAGDQAFASRLPFLQRLFENKWYVDELYDRIVIRPVKWLARVCWKVIDVLVIDGSIHVGAFVTEITGDLGRLTTTGNVRNYALYFFGGILVLFALVLL